MSWKMLHETKKGSLPIVLFMVMSGVMGVVAVSFTRLSYPTLQIRQNAPNAKVSFDQTERAVHIDGELGARLVGQVRSALRRHRDARMVVLNSVGGLVEDALEVATMVHADGLATRIDGVCASACVAIWAAGSRHEMTIESRVGLHQLYFIGEVSPLFTEPAKDTLNEKYDSFLRNAGFDSTIIKIKNGTPSSKVYWLGASQVVNSGVSVTIIGRNGVALANAIVNWLQVENSLGNDNSLMPLMSAIRIHAMALVEQHIEMIRNSFTTRNPEAIQYAMASLSQDALRYALLRATDHATISWGTSLYSTMSTPNDRKLLCKLLTREQRKPLIIDATNTRVANSINKALVELINSIRPDSVPRGLPIRDSPVIIKVMQSTWRESERAGLPSNSENWTTAQNCEFRVRFIGRALTLPLQEASNAIRYIELNK